MKNYLGLIYALSAYLWWGILPIFWKNLDHVPSLEIVTHRVIWACVIVFLIILLMREWSTFIALFKQKRILLQSIAASVLMTINWGVFIWAVTNQRIVETSLGYFINPLATVLFGMLFFGETLSKYQAAALLIAALGVAVMVFANGEVPIISLALAITFASYSVVKKKMSVSASHGLAIETLLMMIPAVIFLIYLESQGQNSFGGDIKTDVMLIMGGLVTLVPLLLFAAAVSKMSMTALGMTQYIGPICQLFIAVLIYNEPFGQERQLAFGLIWLALVVYSVDQLNAQRLRRIERRKA